MDLQSMHFYLQHKLNKLIEASKDSNIELAETQSLPFSTFSLLMKSIKYQLGKEKDTLNNEIKGLEGEAKSQKVTTSKTESYSQSRPRHRFIDWAATVFFAVEEERRNFIVRFIAGIILSVGFWINFVGSLIQAIFDVGQDAVSQIISSKKEKNNAKKNNNKNPIDTQLESLNKNKKEIELLDDHVSEIENSVREGDKKGGIPLKDLISPLVRLRSGLIRNKSQVFGNNSDSITDKLACWHGKIKHQIETDKIFIKSHETLPFSKSDHEMLEKADDFSKEDKSTVNSGPDKFRSRLKSLLGKFFSSSEINAGGYFSASAPENKATKILGMAEKVVSAIPYGVGDIASPLVGAARDGIQDIRNTKLNNGLNALASLDSDTFSAVKEKLCDQLIKEYFEIINGLSPQGAENAAGYIFKRIKKKIFAAPEEFEPDSSIVGQEKLITHWVTKLTNAVVFYTPQKNTNKIKSLADEEIFNIEDNNADELEEKNNGFMFHYNKWRDKEIAEEVLSLILRDPKKYPDQVNKIKEMMDSTLKAPWVVKLKLGKEVLNNVNSNDEKISNRSKTKVNEGLYDAVLERIAIDSYEIRSEVEEDRKKQQLMRQPEVLTGNSAALPDRMFSRKRVDLRGYVSDRLAKCTPEQKKSLIEHSILNSNKSQKEITQCIGNFLDSKKPEDKLIIEVIKGAIKQYSGDELNKEFIKECLQWTRFRANSEKLRDAKLKKRQFLVDVVTSIKAELQLTHQLLGTQSPQPG